MFATFAQRSTRRISAAPCWMLAGVILLASIAARAAAPAAKPATQPTPDKDGWLEVDQRLVFLTVQLSTIEASIDATDKALRAAGYKKLNFEAAADKARFNNELMDRKGGGPVPWQEFYGKTAERFFYHPAGRNTIHVNPRPIDQRPPQFDYIYRANEQARAKAEAEAGKVGNKIDDLLAYRRQLEAEQTALWCKIAFRGVASMDLPARPLYGLDLATAGTDEAAKQSLECARAAVAFMRAIDAEVATAQKGLDDPKAAFGTLLQSVTAARAEFQGKLLRLTTVAASMTNPKSPISQFNRLTKRLEDAAQNLVDAQRLASDCEAQDDQAGKRTYRGYFQGMIYDLASSIVAADQALVAATTEWKIAPSVAPVASTGTKNPTATTGATAGSAEDLTARLQAAKATHQKELADARRALVQAIDQRLNAAADAGDLAGVQALQGAKVKAAHDGSVADTVKDPAIIGAKRTMDQAVQAAGARLVAAYKDTISGLVRARRITEAQAIQEELNGSGLPLDSTTASTGTTEPKTTTTGGGGVGVTPVSSDGAFPPPKLPDGKLEIELPAPADEVVVGGAGRYLILHLKKLQQLGVFDVSQAKMVKYLPLASNDIAYAASQKKLYIALKDLRKLQRWDLTKLDLELTVATPEGGFTDIATGAAAQGPIVAIAEKAKRFWLVNPVTLKAEPYPSKNWGTDGSAWGPCHVHVSFDGSTAVACGGGWAGIELSTLSSANKVTNVIAGSYVNGDTLVAGNGALVFPEGGGIIRSDLEAKVSGIDGKPFPALDTAFSCAYRKDGGRNSKEKPSVVIYSNADPRPLITLRDLPELGKDSKLPMWQRVNLIPRAKVLVTVGDGADHLVLRSFDVAKELEAEGIDYLFVESAPVATVNRGQRYSYKMLVRSKKGSVKTELQSGPKGMTVSKDGLVTWTAPLRAGENHATVIIQISDASGQTIFHSFGITVVDVAIRR